jgi:hypothetical protein
MLEIIKAENGYIVREPKVYTKSYVFIELKKAFEFIVRYMNNITVNEEISVEISVKQKESK